MNKYLVKKIRYEIRQIDAWLDPDSGWCWNASFPIAAFETGGNDHKAAFLRALHKRGIVCKRGKCFVEWTGDIYELRDRKTDKPFFAAIPLD